LTNRQSLKVRIDHGSCNFERARRFIVPSARVRESPSGLGLAFGTTLTLGGLVWKPASDLGLEVREIVMWAA
jgi:hypothetical protein